jgi:plasmid replication initiation protein
MNHTRSAEEKARDIVKAEERRARQKTHLMRERTDKPLEDRFVNMTNILARSAQGLKLTEKRVIAIALAKTDSVPERDLFLAQERGWTIRISAEEYASQYHVSHDAAYMQLRDGESIMKSQLKYLSSDNKGVKEISINWCGRYIYHRGEGWCEFSFTPQIAPFLLALRGNKSPFTSYQLNRGAALDSIYSWRLLECLLSWSGTGRWEPTVDEFIYAMELPASYKKDFGATRRRVIEPAIIELRVKDNLEITYKIKKLGRKVIGLIFTFKENPKRKLI